MSNGLESLDWADMTKRLTIYSRDRSGVSWEIAEEIAQEAITRFLDPAYAGAWDEDDVSEKDVMKQLGSTVNGIIQNRRRTKSLTHVVSADPLDPLTALSKRTNPGGQDELEVRELGKRALALLLEELTDEDLLQNIVLQEWWQVSKPADQARNLDVPVAKIYKARRELKDYYDGVRARLREEGIDG